MKHIGGCSGGMVVVVVVARVTCSLSLGVGNGDGLEIWLSVCK